MQGLLSACLLKFLQCLEKHLTHPRCSVVFKSISAWWVEPLGGEGGCYVLVYSTQHLPSPDHDIEESSSCVLAKGHCPGCQFTTPHLNFPCLYLFLESTMAPESKDEHSYGARTGTDIRECLLNGSLMASPPPLLQGRAGLVTVGSPLEPSQAPDLGRR